MVVLNPGTDRSHRSSFPSHPVKASQMVQNEVAHMYEPLVNPCPRQLPTVGCVELRSPAVAFRGTSGSEPVYSSSVIRALAPSRPLRSSKERRLASPSLRTRRSRSRPTNQMFSEHGGPSLSPRIPQRLLSAKITSPNVQLSPTVHSWFHLFA